MSKKSSAILSIQSHVAHGYVGNRAAVFPLQRMGFEVTAVNTVQFSNHTGYGRWSGQIFTPEHIEDILKGLDELGTLDQIDVLLTGYLGARGIGEKLLALVQERGLKWACDPVMGDVGRGFFVTDGIPSFFKEQAAPHAWLMTPNQFELEYLTGQPITSLSEAKAACRTLHRLGAEIVLLTSLMDPQGDAHTIQMIASEKDGDQYLVTTPLLAFDPAPNGSGDATAALFVGNLLQGYDVKKSLEQTAGAIFSVFEKTHELERRELALIQAQDDFLAPSQTFKAEKLS